MKKLNETLSAEEINKYFEKVQGAHDKAREYEILWRKQLKLRNDIYGAHPQLKKFEPVARH